MRRPRSLSLVAVAGLLAACGQVAVQPIVVPSTPTVKPFTPTPEIFMPVPDEMRAEVAAREALAQMLGVDVTAIMVHELEPMVWPDTCLGLTIPGRNCHRGPTPGYRIKLDAGEAIYEVRTDAGAETVLIAGQVDSTRGQALFLSMASFTWLPEAPGRASRLWLLQ